jgi:hypothetical protein
MGRNNADFEGGHGLTQAQATSWTPNELDVTRDFDGTPTTVGMVPTHVVARYTEFDRNSENPEKVNRLAKDIAENGIREPLQIDYHHDSGWGTLVEGNHRIAAAMRAGLTHVPVVVTGVLSKRPKGAPLHLSEGEMPTPPEWMTHRNPPYFKQAHPSAFRELAG